MVHSISNSSRSGPLGGSCNPALVVGMWTVRLLAAGFVTLAVAGARQAAAATYTWASGDTTGNWSSTSTTTDWNSATVPSLQGDIAQYTSTTANGTTKLDVSETIGQLQANDAGRLWTISAGGGTLNFDNSTNSVANIFGNNDAAIEVVSGVTGTGALTVAAPISLSNSDLDIGSLSTTAGLTVSGAISATTTQNLNLRENGGSGTITLSGNIGATGSNITINNLSTSTGAINLTGGAIGAAAGGATVTINNTAAGSGTMTIGDSLAASVGLVTENSSTSALVLSGTNTNTAGVTLTTGTLRLGSTTALGATAGTLTINGGTLDSSVANLVLANNNAQTWNGSFTFTGTNSLNLGTGAVTLGSSNLQVTVANKTLTVGGNISGSVGITKAGAGTLVLSGMNAYSGTSTVSAGTLEFVNEVSLYDGQQGIFGGFWNTTQIVVNSGGTLAFAVGGAGQFTASDIQTLSALGTGTGGFLSGSSLGLDASGATFTYGNVIADTNSGANSLGLTAAGGTIILTAANTYSGPTTINSGSTLQIGNGGSAGSLGTAPVNDNGTLAYNLNSATVTLANQIVGTGGLTQNGTGILTLTAANTYSGPTVISSGTLQAHAAIVTPPTIQNASFGAISTGSYTYYGQLTSAQQTTFIWTAGGNGYTGVGSGSTGPAIVVSGNGAWGYSGVTGLPGSPAQLLSLQRTSFVTQSLSFASAGVYTLTWYSEARPSTGGDTIDVELDGTTVSTYTASTSSWFSSGTSPYSTTINVANPGTHTITFAGTNSGADVSVGLTDVGLAFSGSASSLSANSGVQIASGATLDLAGVSSLVASLANSGGAGGTVTSSVSGPVTFTLLPPAASSTSFSGVIQDGSGTLALVVNGPGTQILSGANTYSGATTIQNGTLAIGALNSIPTTSNVVLGAAGGSTSGIFQLGVAGNSANQQVASLVVATGNTATTNAVVGGNSTTSTLNINNSSTDIYTGNLGGTGTNQNSLALTKAGSGTLVLGGTSTYTGPTIVSSGTLRVPTAAYNAGLVQNGGFESPVLGGNTFTAISSLSAAQQAALIWTGTAVLINNSTAWGYTTPYPTGSQAISIQNLDTISQSINFPTAGTYTLVWQAEDRPTYTAGNTVHVQLDGTTVYSYLDTNQSAWANYSTTLTIASAGTHTIAFVGTVASPDESSGLDNVSILPIGLSSASAVQLVNSGASLDINDGFQSIPSLSGVTGATVTLGKGILTLTGSTTATFGGVISDTGGASSNTGGSLVLNETGTEILTGANTYTGLTTITAGTLQLGDGASNNGSVAGNIVNNAALVFANPNSQAFAGTISGSGTLTKSGAGTLSLTATGNTYSGPTVVSTGTLRLAASSTNNISNSSSINVASGATLDPTGLTSGTLVMNAGQNLSGAGSVLGTVSASLGASVSPGANPSGNSTFGAIGTLGLMNLTLSGNSLLNLDLGAAGTMSTPGSSDLATVSGTLTLPNSGGPVAVNLFNNANAGSLGSIGNGTYQILTFGSLANTFSPSQFTVRNSPLQGGTYTFSQTGSGIDLTITGTTGLSPGVFSTVFLGGSSGSSPNFDASIGLNTNKTYLNAVDTGSSTATTINGITFAATTAVAPSGNGSGGTTWSLTGTGILFNAGFTPLVSGNLKSLLSNFVYNGNPAALTLGGLTPGQAYVITFYNAAFDTTAGGVRVMNLTTSDGITTPISFDEDTAALGGSGGQSSTAGQANLLRYTFVATGASETVTITPQIAGNTMHVYGFSTEQVFNNSWVSGTAWGTATWLDSATGTSVLPTYAGSNAFLTAQTSPTIINLDSGGDTVGHIQFDGTNSWTIAGSSTLTLQTDPGGVSVLSTLDGTHTIAAPISLQNGVLKSGTGTLVLTNTVTSNGNTISIQNGTLQFGDGSLNNGTFDGGIVDNSALVFANPNTESYSGVISGKGTLTKSAAGTLTLGGVSTYTGATTINGGTLSISADNNLGAAPASATPGDIVINGGTLSAASSMTLNANRGIALGPANGSGGGTISVASGTLSYGGILANNGSGSGSFTKTGAGTLTLGVPGTYSGTTTISAGTLQLTPLTGQVAQYHLDGPVGAIASGATIADSSGNSLNGTTSAAGLSYVAGGVLNQAVSFNGSALISVPHSSLLALNTYTASAWIDLPSTLASGAVAGILGTRSGTDNTFDMKYENAGGTLKLHGDIGNGVGGWLTTAADYTTTLSLSTWHMITYTVNSSGYSIYVDGVLGTTGSFSGTPLFEGTSSILQIGNTNGTEPMVASGAIDEVNIFGSVLSAAQIQSLYFNGVGELPTATPVSIASGATLDLNGVAQTVVSLSDVTGAGGTVTNSNATTAATLVLTPTATTTFSGVIQDGNSKTNLTINGSGTQILAGANTFSGATTINAGTLQVANSLALQNSAVNVAVNNGLTFSAGLGAATLGGLTGSGNIALQDSTPAAINLSVGNNNASTAYSGALSGLGSLTKVGSGTLGLSGANTYSGATAVTAGTLRLGGVSAPVALTNQTFTSDATALIGATSPYGSSGYSVALAFNQGANLSINGVTFTNTGTATSGTGWSVSGLPNNGASGTFPAGFTLASNQQTFALLNHFYYGAGNPEVLTITGLTPGDAYDARLYYREWGTNDNRTANFVFDPGTGSTTTLNNLNEDADANAHYLDYTYFVGSTGTLTLTITPQNSGFTWHVYGFSNQLISGQQGSLPTTTALTVASGATFDLNGNSQQVVSLGNISGSGGTVTNSSGNTPVLTLAPATSTTTTFSGVIQDGAGGGTTALTVNGTGTGTQVLSGANTYSGGTIVSGGVLSVQNASGSATGTGNVIVQTGGTLSGTGTTGAGFIVPGAGNSVTIQSGGKIVGTAGGTLTIGSGTGTSGTLNLLAGSTASFVLPAGPNAAPLISVGTLVVPTGSGNNVTVLITPSTPAGGVYDLISFGSGPGTASTAANFVLGTSAPSGYTWTLSTIAPNGSTYGQLDLTVSAPPITWTGHPGGNGTGTGLDVWDINTTSNWANASNAATVYSDGTGVTFGDTNATGGPAPDGKVWIVNGGVNPSSVNFANHAVAYAINPSGAPAGAGSGAIGGSGTNVTVGGGGSVTFNTADTYTGSTTINNNSTLIISADNALGAAPSSATLGSLVLGSGTLRATGSFTLNANRGVTLAGFFATGAINVATGNTLTYGGAINDNSNGNALAVNSGSGNTGTLVLNGPNTGAGANNYSGGTNVNAGTLQIGDGSTGSGSLGSGSVTIAASAQLTFDPAANVTFTNPISGAGSLTLNSDSNSTLTLTPSGTNNYGGSTTIAKGTLQLGSSSALPLGTALTIGTTTNGTLDLNGFNATVSSLATGPNPTNQVITNNNDLGSPTSSTLTYAGTGSSTYGGQITFNSFVSTAQVALNVTSGTLSLSGNSNSYGGGTTVTGGTLQVSNSGGSATGTGPVSVGNGSATLSGGGTLGGFIALGAGNAVTINSGGTIVGGTTSAPLHISGGSGLVLLAGSISSFAPTTASTSSPLISVNSLTAPTSGTALVSITGSPAAGTYDLIGYGTAGSGFASANFAFQSSEPASWSLIVQNSQLDLVIASGGGGNTPMNAVNYWSASPPANNLSFGSTNNWSVQASNGYINIQSTIPSGIAPASGSPGGGGPFLTTDGTAGANPLYAAILAGTNSGTFTGGSAAVTMSWRARAKQETSLQEGGTPSSPPLQYVGSYLISNVLQLQGLGTSGSSANYSSTANTPYFGAPSVTEHETDPFVLQMNYNVPLLSNEAGQAKKGTIYLGWLAPAGLSSNGTLNLAAPTWQKASTGDFNGSGQQTGTAANGPDALANFQGTFAALLSAENTAHPGLFTDDPTLNPANLSNSDLAALLGSYGVDTTGHDVWAVINHNSQFAVVPEPNALLLAALGLAGLAGYRVRRRGK